MLVPRLLQPVATPRRGDKDPSTSPACDEDPHHWLRRDKPRRVVTPRRDDKDGRQTVGHIADGML